jgi:hypothetical protein
MFKKLCTNAAFDMLQTASIQKQKAILRGFENYYDFLVADINEKIAKRR